MLPLELAWRALDTWKSNSNNPFEHNACLDTFDGDNFSMRYLHPAVYFADDSAYLKSPPLHSSSFLVKIHH